MVTLSEEGRVVTCNVAGLRILRVTLENIRNKAAAEFFAGPNAWILEKIKSVEETLKLENAKLFDDVQNVRLIAS